jgi:hypothetical protein
MAAWSSQTPKEQKAQEESRAATQSICRGC